MSKNPSKKDELSQSLKATLGTSLLRLQPSELKEAQAVIPGQNRPDLVVGGAPALVLPAATAPAQAPQPPPAARPESKPTPAPRPAAKKPPPTPRKGGRAPGFTRLDLALRKDQLEVLMKLEFGFRMRTKREERVTKASIIRAVLDVLPHLDLNHNEITDEDTLREAILDQLQLNRPKGLQVAPKTAQNA